MKPNRAPQTSWPLRRDFAEYVLTSYDDGIFLFVGDEWFHIKDRATARLLAKRVNQCLDATARR